MHPRRVCHKARGVAWFSIFGLEMPSVCFTKVRSDLAKMPRAILHPPCPVFRRCHTGQVQHGPHRGRTCGGPRRPRRKQARRHNRGPPASPAALDVVCALCIVGVYLPTGRSTAIIQRMQRSSFSLWKIQASGSGSATCLRTLPSSIRRPVVVTGYIIYLARHSVSALSALGGPRHSGLAAGQGLFRASDAEGESLQTFQRLTTAGYQKWSGHP